MASRRERDLPTIFRHLAPPCPAPSCEMPSQKGCDPLL
ncbi:hypothetical protein K788_0000906 [Paraburkholderia caribensis MBA4]|uniref:Uncharacterized protein n=1 Tax=Paraburkholderia caribensis MBA4 TaxID=1323664 RepID=A0A0P0RH46_9BURK|nr:hypothetical protein K788_0000906 [Paraburkholderia caribensis MBA4]